MDGRRTVDDQSDIAWSETVVSDDEDIRYGSSTSIKGFSSADPDSMITFLSAESTRSWRIHSSVLTPQSATFAKIHNYYAHPGSSGPSTDPCSWIPTLDRSGINSYQLVRIADEDFDCFLQAVQPRLGTELILDELCRMLVIATDWQFTDLRNYAIRSIPKYTLEPVQKIQLARRTNIPAWIRDPYVALVTRLAPLDKDETAILGLESTSAISAARETVQRRRLSLISGKYPPEWMGTNFWHSGCWSTMTDAWNNALEEGRFFTMTPFQALMGALTDLKSTPDSSPKEGGANKGRKLCSNCDDERKIAAWLNLDQDNVLAEKVLRQKLGGRPEKWIDKR